MTIGVLKETGQENRVALLPESAASLIKLGFTVIVEKDAGTNAFSSDDDYRKAGAEVVSQADIFSKAGLILCVNIPSEATIANLKKESILLGHLNPLANKDLINKLVSVQASSFSLDFIPRTTRAQSMDILSSMATVAGYKAVLDAAAHLPKFFPMFMSAAGTIKPSKVLILGAGVAGLQAIAVARKLGAVVEVFDVRAAVKEEVKSLGGKFIEVEGAKDDSKAGGYAVEQTEEFKQKQRELIHAHASGADVVICTAQIPGKKAPILLKADTVKQMKAGSVVIDLAASTGGNCEVTENGKTIQVNGVTIIGKSDYPSTVPVDASRMFANNLINFIKILFKPGTSEINFDDELVKGTCITHNGAIASERFNQLSSSN